MSKTKNIAYIALCVALIAVCAQIQIPYTIPFTLQTFAVFFTLIILGGKLGFVAILCYILLGLIGIPIFAGFKGGLSAIMSITGGFIVGFLFIALIYWLFERINFKGSNILSAILGTITLYFIGTLWFIVISNDYSLDSVKRAILLCVVPFIIPDTLKILLANLLGNKINKIIKIKKNTC